MTAILLAVACAMPCGGFGFRGGGGCTTGGCSSRASSSCGPAGCIQAAPQCGPNGCDPNGYSNGAPLMPQGMSVQGEWIISDTSALDIPVPPPPPSRSVAPALNGSYTAPRPAPRTVAPPVPLPPPTSAPVAPPPISVPAKDYGPSFNGINDKVEKSNTAIADLTTRTERIESSIATLTTRVGTMETAVTATQKEVVACNQKLDTLLASQTDAVASNKKIDQLIALVTPIAERMAPPQSLVKSEWGEFPARMAPSGAVEFKVGDKWVETKVVGGLYVAELDGHKVPLAPVDMPEIKALADVKK